MTKDTLPVCRHLLERDASPLRILQRSHEFPLLPHAAPRSSFTWTAGSSADRGCGCLPLLLGRGARHRLALQASWTHSSRRHHDQPFGVGPLQVLRACHFPHTVLGSTSWGRWRHRLLGRKKRKLAAGMGVVTIYYPGSPFPVLDSSKTLCHMVFPKSPRSHKQKGHRVMILSSTCNSLQRHYISFSTCWKLWQFFRNIFYLLGFPGGSVVKNLPAKAGDTGSIPGLERPCRRKRQSTPIFLPGKSHG